MARRDLELEHAQTHAAAQVDVVHAVAFATRQGWTVANPPSVQHSGLSLASTGGAHRMLERDNGTGLPQPVPQTWTAPHAMAGVSVRHHATSPGAAYVRPTQRAASRPAAAMPVSLACVEDARVRTWF